MDIFYEIKQRTYTRGGQTNKGENPPKYCPDCCTDMFKFSKIE